MPWSSRTAQCSTTRPSWTRWKWACRTRKDRPVGTKTRSTVASFVQTTKFPVWRPDMAPWLFTEAILKDQPIKVFGRG